MNSKLKLTLVAASSAAIATAVTMQRMETLIVNGKPHQVAVRVIDNSAYVKLADVAKALDMVLAKKSDGVYELTRAGGTHQVDGLRGKVGETLFDGQWRFTLTSFAPVASYKMKNAVPPHEMRNRLDYDFGTQTATATAGHKLYVATIRVANGAKEGRSLWTAPTDAKVNTALADMDAGSHRAIMYDFHGGPIMTEKILPGASLTFALVFSLPENVKPKDLIFTLMSLEADNMVNHVRIALPQEGDGG
jgi:hypothetical protein